MGELVELKNNKPLVSTFNLYEKMGYSEHRKLKEVINGNREAFNEVGFPPLEREKLKGSRSGRPTESYLLDEDQFILLVLLAKNTPESVDLKVRVAREFRRLRKQVATLAVRRESEEWQNTRKDGKTVYMQKSDVIKQFVDYATKQGSKSAAMYYANLAKMENRALFLIDQKYPNLREILTIRQLMQVATADQAIEKALIEGMEQGMGYKDIYVLAKERVTAFAKIIGQSQVFMLEGK